MDRPSAADVIRVRGARAHNLQNIDVELPLGRFTVITGVSGSGKSSLLFETLYEEGQARFWDALMLGRHQAAPVPRPDVAGIEGLPPVIGVGQGLSSPDRRGTLASLADVSSLLEGLFAATGVLFCPTCQIPVRSQSRRAIVDAVLRRADRTKVMLLAPVVRAERGAHADLFPRIAKEGYVRARVDGTLIDVATAPELPPQQPHTIEIVVDRLVVKDGVRSRLEESLESALALGRGTCLISIESAGEWADTLWSTQLACPQCQRSFPPIERRTFQQASPVGACTICTGTGSNPVAVTDRNRDDSHVCSVCRGSGLGDIGRSVRVGEWTFPAWTAQSVNDAVQSAALWNDAITAAGPPFLEPEHHAVAQHLIPELHRRLTCLDRVGLSYLVLNRRTPTLSTGEVQRTRLAAALSGDVTGIAFLLDEPTAGLHSQDTDRLLDILHGLVAQGNTVIAVEHDLDVVRAADWVVDLGPSAGPHGGRVLAACPPDELPQHPESVTARFLVESSAKSATVWKPDHWLRFGPCSLNNLCAVTLELPLQGIVGVCGVSGSGKTTLFREALVPALRRRLLGPHEAAPDDIAIDFTAVDKRPEVVMELATMSLGRSPWAVTATLCGVWTEIRRLYARTREARLRGFDAKRFSFRDHAGACPRCQGRGRCLAKAPHTLPVDVMCSECGGRRFDQAVLTVVWRGRSVADLLETSIDDAAALFAPIPRLAKPLRLLQSLGLGYLTLGQPAATLSGGERQRLRIARHLSGGSSEPAMFVLDEPTLGLHPAEIDLLVGALQQLRDAGHSVVVIEHNLEFLKQCDWLIELGPGAGPRGGQIIAAGPPAKFSGHHTPTAQAMRDGESSKTTGRFRERVS